MLINHILTRHGVDKNEKEKENCSRTVIFVKETLSIDLTKVLLTSILSILHV